MINMADKLKGGTTWREVDMKTGGERNTTKFAVSNFPSIFKSTALICQYLKLLLKACIQRWGWSKNFEKGLAILAININFGAHNNSSSEENDTVKFSEVDYIFWHIPMVIFIWSVHYFGLTWNSMNWMSAVTIFTRLIKISH